MEGTPTIQIVSDPQDQASCTVGFQDDYWLGIPSQLPESAPSSPEVTAYVGEPYSSSGLPLTGGAEPPFSAPPDCGVNFGRLQLTPENLPASASIGYDSFTPSSFHEFLAREGVPSSTPSSIEDTIEFPAAFSQALNPHIENPQQCFPVYPLYPQAPGPAPMGYNQGFGPCDGSPYSSASQNSSYGSLSPISPSSPVISTSSGSPSSFTSPPNTTDSGQFGYTIPKPRSFHDLSSMRGPERGRSTRRRYSPNVSPSRKLSPYEYSSRPPNDGPRITDPYLTVPGSLLMVGSSLSRRHTVSAGSRYQSANMSAVRTSTLTQDMALLSIDPGSVSNSTFTQRNGTTVASEAIIAACQERRQREAKFQCDVCPQTFTAKHNLKNHKKAHDGIKDQICLRCGNAFRAPGTLTRHTKKCKGPTVDQTS